MKQVCWHSRRSKAYRGLPGHAWQELLWKKPPLRTSTYGRHRFRTNHPLWEPRVWQGQVWEARSDGESTRGKAKFGKRHGSRKWEEENSATRRRRRGKGRKRQKTPSPPYNVPHTPLGGLLSIPLYFSNAGNASAAIFWWFLASAVVLRKGSPASAGASAGIRACVGRYVNQNGWFSGPCLATLLPRLTDVFLSNSWHCNLHCEDVLCLEGFSARSPGSWQGGSWVSALLSEWFSDTFARSCFVVWCWLFVSVQDLLIHRHISCLPHWSCLVSASFLGFVGFVCFLGGCCGSFLFVVLLCFRASCLVGLTRPRTA